MSKKSNNIRVMCRFRPMNEMEHSKDGMIIYKKLTKNGVSIDHPDKIHHPQAMQFYFDKIFDKKSAQVEVFEEAALPLIDNIFEGYNATIFAYGQTGAGKTHTMMGDMIKSEMHPRVGIIPRVVKEIWNRIVHASTNYEFELKVSFLEIYNEQIYDLLSTSNNRKKKQREKLIIREYSDQVFVENLNEIYVRDQNELFDLIKSANKKRISAETKMNRSSSRSHAVLTIILGQEDIRTGNSKKSKFCLVDLAGSEKVGKTQAKGIRLKEATSINKSLTTLGTCMNKLADNMSAGSGQSMRHIPFRESVLTRLLSDSLGGNCKTTLIINASPCSYNVEETISTLRFGERAKKIKTKARINQIKTPQQYRKELQAAQTEIMKLYRIIEDCAYDINNAFKGTLNVENCKSYKKLLDLKKYTLNIINGKSTDDVSSSVSNSLLANILPDLTNLQGLKKVHTVKKQQKKTGVLNMQPLVQQNSGSNILHPQRSLSRQGSTERIKNTVISPNPNPASPSHSKSMSFTHSPNPNISNPSQLKPSTSKKNTTDSPQFDPSNKLRRARYGSFEELDVDNAMKLVHKNKAKKVDPLKRKNSKNDFKVNGNNANAAFKPPEFDYSKLFNTGGHDDGLSLGQMTGAFNMSNDAEYNSQIESEFSDYNSEYDNLGIMSPAPDGTMSDTSNMDYGMFNYKSDATSGLENNDQFEDFQEEELPKNFFEMDMDQREAWAKQKNLDPKLVDYRFQISREIDWEHWNSDDEELDSKEDKDKEIEEMNRVELENGLEYERARMMMLCRLLRTKSQEFGSRIEIEMNRYNSLKQNYRAKNEENNRLMDENRAIEKEYQIVENEKRELQKLRRQLRMDLEDAKKRLAKLEKQLTLKANELNIERQTQIKLSRDKSSMLRKRVHEKYAEKYKKIENEIIENDNKDIDSRFNELAKAFKSQSAKYQDLEGVIENSKQQMAKYEELIKQKEQEQNTLMKEIEDEDLRRKELIYQHNTELKQIRDQMKKAKNKADMWKRRAFVYKNAVNSLMEEQDFMKDESEQEPEPDTTFDFKRDRNRDRDEYKNESSDNPPSFKVDLLAHAKLKPLNSFSPRAQLGLVELEKQGKDRDIEDRESLSPSSGGGSGGSRGKSKKKRLSTKSPRYHRKSRGSIGAVEDLMLGPSANKLQVPGSTRSGLTDRNRDRDRRNKQSKLRQSGYERAMSPIRNEPFHMTPSQKAALTSVKMKIRGGGGSDEDVYRTPIKTQYNTQSPPRIRGTVTGSLRSRKEHSQSPLRGRHNRNISQPLTQSLPRPTNYSSDEQYTPHTLKSQKKNTSYSKRKSMGYDNKSREAMPVSVGIDSLVRNRSIEYDEMNFDASPSPFLMQDPIGRKPMSMQSSKSGSCSPRESRQLPSERMRKKGTSPLPPPPRSVKQRTSMDADNDDSSDEEFEEEFSANPDPDHFLSPKSHTSPAGSFFSKIKHTANANDDPEDDYKTPTFNKTPITRRQKSKPMSGPGANNTRPRPKAVPMPEPTGMTSDDDEFGGDSRFSDTSNFTDDNPPSYRHLPSASSSQSSLYASGRLGGSNKFAQQRNKRRAVQDGTMD